MFQTRRSARDLVMVFHFWGKNYIYKVVYLDVCILIQTGLQIDRSHLTNLP